MNQPSQEGRLAALKRDRRERYPDYDAWHRRRHVHTIEVIAETNRLFPGLGQFRRADKHSRTKLRQWDKANPSPLAWEDWQASEIEFAKTYVPTDYS